jgi:hypothetical protein
MGEEEVGLRNLYPISLFYPFKMGVRAEHGPLDGGGGNGAGEAA